MSKPLKTTLTVFALLVAAAGIFVVTVASPLVGVALAANVAMCVMWNS